jgi:lysophospholipase L1-like esterase
MPTFGRFVGLLASLSISLASTAYAQETGSPPSVFIVGDSHVQRVGPMLTARLGRGGFRALGYESRPGWSTRRYREAGDLRAVLERSGRPEIVIVSLGGNDFVSSRERYAEDLGWVVSEARAAGARHIVWLGPASSDASAGERAASTAARHEANAELQRELLGELAVRWIDSRPLTLTHHGRDGVHFTRTGYVTWTDAVLPEIAPIEDAPEVG